MKTGRLSPFMQTAKHFKMKYSAEWAEVEAKVKAENAKQEGNKLDTNKVVKQLIQENTPALDELAHS